MSENQKKFQQIWDRVHGGIPGQPARQKTRVADSQDMADLPARVLNEPIEYSGDMFPKGSKTNLRVEISWLPVSLRTITAAVNQANETLAALMAMVKASSEKQGIDPETLEKLVTDAVRDAVGTYELRKVEGE